jgi:putative ABC transport system permease protein
MPQIKEISFSSDNIPFSQTVNQAGVTYNRKRTINVNWYQVEDSYKDALQMQVLEGRWFNQEDAVRKDWPVVINASLKESLFGHGDAIGKLIGDYEDKSKMKVIGVVEDVKARGDYASPGTAVYNKLDTASFHWLGRMLIQVAPNSDAAFESRLYKTLANYMKNANVEIEHMTNKRKNANYFSLVPMIIMLIVACFLIINVALGLFGVLWYNINKRRNERQVCFHTISRRSTDIGHLVPDHRVVFCPAVPPVEYIQFADGRLYIGDHFVRIIYLRTGAGLFALSGQTGCGHLPGGGAV